KREKTEASDSLDSSGLSRPSEHAHHLLPRRPFFHRKGFKATKRMVRSEMLSFFPRRSAALSTSFPTPSCATSNQNINQVGNFHNRIFISLRKPEADT